MVLLNRIGFEMLLSIIFSCRLLGYPFPPESSTGAKYKYFIEVICNRMTITNNGHANRNHKNDRHECDEISPRMYWQIDPAKFFKPGLIHSVCFRSLKIFFLNCSVGSVNNLFQGHP